MISMKIKKERTMSMAYFSLNIGSFCSVIQSVVPNEIWSLYELEGGKKKKTLSQPDEQHPNC